MVCIINAPRLHGNELTFVMEPYFVKSYGKAVAIQRFSKRNWTPASIPMVSKLVSSYGGDEGIRTLVRLPAN